MFHTFAHKVTKVASATERHRQKKRLTCISQLETDNVHVQAFHNMIWNGFRTFSSPRLHLRDVCERVTGVWLWKASASSTSIVWKQDFVCAVVFAYSHILHATNTIISLSLFLLLSKMKCFWARNSALCNLKELEKKLLAWSNFLGAFASTKSSQHSIQLGQLCAQQTHFAM